VRFAEAGSAAARLVIPPTYGRPRVPLESPSGLIAVLLFAVGVAAVIDLASHRIPNGLVLATALAGVVLQGWTGGLAGLLSAFAGGVLGLLIFLPFYIYKVMGAGDVKLIGAVGTFLGPQFTLLAAACILMAGGLIGILVLVCRRGAVATATRYMQMLRYWARGIPTYLPPAAGEAAATRFPYAIAIATGTVGALWHAGELQRLGGLFA
jgi:prepilin peptidase CpaA